MLTHSNILRIVIAFCLIDTGIAYRHCVRSATSPAVPRRSSIARSVRSEAPFRVGRSDPSALVVTAHRHRLLGHRGHVGLRDPALYESKKTLSIDAFTGVKMVASLFHPLNIFILGLGGDLSFPRC